MSKSWWFLGTSAAALGCADPVAPRLEAPRALAAYTCAPVAGRCAAGAAFAFPPLAPDSFMTAATVAGAATVHSELTMPYAEGELMIGLETVGQSQRAVWQLDRARSWVSWRVVARDVTGAVIARDSLRWSAP